MSAAPTRAAGSSQGGRFAQFIDWVDERFPLTAMMKEHVTEYYAAKNFNAWYVFGVLALPFHLMITYTGLVTLMFMYMPWGAQAVYLGGCP